MGNGEWGMGIFSPVDPKVPSVPFVPSRFLMNPERFWKSPKSLRRAREESLRIARAARDKAPPADVQIYSSSHSGDPHLDLFHRELKQIVEALPPGFRALEWGAGMAWHAALLAAHGAGIVTATEAGWTHETPHALGNVYTLYRMAQKEPRLMNALRFGFDETKTLRTVHFPDNLSFLHCGAEAMPVRDASLDFLYSVNCVEHIPRLDLAFAEAARTLRLGGQLYATTEPLYYSAQGHHLGDIFAIPWGHLLWTADELADLVVKEAGDGREWAPGIPLRREHLLENVFPTLNGTAPADIRRALAGGPWQITSWLDMASAEDEQAMRQIGLRDALSGIPPEALLLRGLQFRLRRTDGPTGLRWPMRLSHRLRGALRSIIPR
ncbi:hypothetical protein BH09SUM1_BH09SUM1_06860 [soil metagenome]